MDLVTTNSEFKRIILMASGRRFYEKLVQKSPLIEENVRVIVSNAIRNSDAVLSLLGYDIGINNLKKQFGLTDSEASSTIDKIILIVINSISFIVEKKESTQKVDVSSKLIILPETLQYNLGKTIGVYTSESSGIDINWLDWLLTRGLEIVVGDYRLFLTDAAKSRAGGAIMVKQPGSFYRVDSRYSGVVGDNFLTRAILESEQQISDIISKAIQ